MSEKEVKSLMINLDEQNLGKAKHFFSIYDAEILICDSAEKTYLGTRNLKACRFCKNTIPEVTFKKDAHVIPQFLGNKNLLSYFECDECNKYFCGLEDSFANYLGLTRSFTGIKGQQGKTPKYKDINNGLEVFRNDETGNIEVKMVESKFPVKFAEDNKSGEIFTQRPSYIPIHVPKLLIKIGLSMLEDEDIDDYDYARRFIRQSEKDINFKDSDWLRILGYFIPGPPIYSKPFVLLYKKKKNQSKSLYPTRQLILLYANFLFQIILPFSKSDEHLRGNNFECPIFPLLVDNSHFERYGRYQEFSLNLTSHEKRKGEKLEFTFRFDNLYDLSKMGEMNLMIY